MSSSSFPSASHAPLRILHTESSLGMGGQEYRVVAEALGMMNRGHEVLLAVPKESQLAYLGRQKGLRVETTPQGTRGWVTAVPRFVGMIRRNNIDVVNTHGSFDSWTASIAGRMSSMKPLIIRTRHKSTPISQTLRHRLLYRKLPHGIITTSEFTRGEMIRGQGLNPTQIISIPTGIDFSKFTVTQGSEDIRKEFGIKERSPLLGIVAFLRNYKGIHVCLDAVRQLIEEFPDLMFLVVGDGPEAFGLRARVKILGIENHVRFAGFREDIPQILSSLDIFVFPSTEGEGVPQALMQAMAMGIPVVGTSIGGIPEVLIHKVSGLLVAPKDSFALKESIRELIQNTSLRTQLAQRAKTLALESYSLDSMVNKVEDWYSHQLATKT